MSVWITGTGLWAPGFASVGAFRAGAADPAQDMPACALPPARSKRGTSRIARMLGEVVSQAADAASADLATVATVYASAWGEIDIMVALLAQIHEGEATLSPLRFKHSVHNAASGLMSIAAGNRGFSTAVAAGERTFEMGLLEALTLAEAGDVDVVLAVGDDRLPEPLDRFGGHEGLAVGFCLSGTRPAGVALRLDAPAGGEGEGELPAPYAGNPTVHALPLLLAVAGERGGRIHVGPGAHVLVHREEA